MSKTKIVSGVAILAVVLLGIAVFRGGVLGGTTHFQKESFVEGLYAGVNRVFEITRTGVLNLSAAANFSGTTTFDSEQLNSYPVATSSAASAALLSTDLPCNGTLLVSLPVGAVTLTTPASSTLSTKLPVAGDRCSVAIVNASTTAGQTVTLAAGTGWKIATTTEAQLVIHPGTVGILDIIRKTNTDFTALLRNQGHAQ